MVRREQLAKTPGAEQFLCALKHQTNSEESEWCSSYYKNYSAYEFHHGNLAEELKRRRRLPGNEVDTKYMPEPEMWFLLRAMSTASQSLKSKGLFHGDIQPRHVLIDDEAGVKMTEAPLINQYFTGYNRMALEADYHAALSPEQLETLSQRKPDVKQGYTEKDEVYSLGITALCAATNQPITEFYDYGNYTVKQDRINQSLKHMSDIKYSDELVKFIANCLNQDPASRASLDQLVSITNKPHDVVEEYEVEAPGIYAEETGQYFNQMA